MNNANAKITYDLLVRAIHAAIDEEQPDGGGQPFKDSTERQLTLVYTLLRDTLGLTAEDLET
jgi:hypothetical protein